MFVVSDYPHVLKKVVNGLSNKNRVLLRPRAGGRGEDLLSLQMLEKVWRVHRDQGARMRECGGELALRQDRLSEQHFHKTRFSKMRVHLAAQVMSRSMLRMIDVVTGPEGILAADKEQYGALRQLVACVDRLTDIANCRGDSSPSRAACNPIWSADDPQLKELLHILAFFASWRAGLVGVGADLHKHFLSSECWEDLKSNVLGSVTFAVWFTKDRDDRCAILRKLQQDCVEHHFSNVRAHAGESVSLSQPAGTLICSPAYCDGGPSRRLLSTCPCAIARFFSLAVSRHRTLLQCCQQRDEAVCRWAFQLRVLAAGNRHCGRYPADTEAAGAPSYPPCVRACAVELVRVPCHCMLSPRMIVALPAQV